MARESNEQKKVARGISEVQGFKFVTDREQFGRMVRAARILNGLTQSQLAERVGCCKMCISKAEKGGGISLTTVVKLYEALGDTMNQLSL